MSNKTPVSILQEYCVKKGVSVPFYEDLPEEATETGKIFHCTALACGKSASGSGLNKKTAKHCAAANLLEQFGIKTNFSSDIEEEKHNSVMQLLDLCIANNWPLAVFEDIQASGPSHCPEFTVRCTLSSLVREATSSTKKAAKQKVAVLMLQVIQEMQMMNPEKLQVMQIKEAMQLEDETEEKIVKTYMEYKKMDVKKALGVKLCDRHGFFMSLDADRVKRARNILIDQNEPDDDKICSMMQALGLKYKIQEVPSYDKCLLSFEMEHENYDCYIVEFEDKFWKTIIDYFSIMLDVRYNQTAIAY